MQLSSDFRRWVQAVFHLKSLNYSNTEAVTKLQLLSKESSQSDNRVIEPITESEIDMSEGIIEMFGMSNSNNEVKDYFKFFLILISQWLFFFFNYNIPQSHINNMSSLKKSC